MRLDRLKRREFNTLLGVAALAQCLAIHPVVAQGVRPRSAHIGFISGLDAAAAEGFLAPFRDGLSVQGYVEPSTLKIEQLFANYDLERIPALLEQLVCRLSIALM
jgi:hypothetical protein